VRPTPTLVAALVAMPAWVSLAPALAQAEEPEAPGAVDARPAVVLPTRVLDEREEPPDPADRTALLLRHRLDGLLTEAAQDLGLSLDLTHRGVGSAPPSELELAALATRVDAMVIAPTLVLGSGAPTLRLVIAMPSEKNLLLRVERVSPAELEVRAAVMLRDLLRGAEPGGARPSPPSERPRAQDLATPARSAGRPALAVGATLFGGFFGYSVLRSSGSDDPRLLYPLLAVGAGIGLGGSLIIADEWDVGAGDAGFIVSGALWPSVAGHLLYEGRFAKYADRTDERWTFGLVGGTMGITLVGLGLVNGGMSESGAVLSHSGGGLGLVFGGLTELFVRGEVDATPSSGMGYGAAAGWLAASAAATQLHLSAGQILAADLGAVLGGLSGAALASPLLFEAPTEAEQRGWVAITAGTTVLGAGVAWAFARNTDVASGPRRLNLTPHAGVLGASQSPAGPVPIYGLGLGGTL
jgi:hypothetical protein